MAEPVDLDHLDEIADYDQEFRKELISVYLFDAQDLIEQLIEAVRQGNSEGISVAAHSLKGASSNVGALDVEKSAAALEELARQCVQKNKSIQTADRERFDQLGRRIEESFAMAKSFLEEII